MPEHIVRYAKYGALLVAVGALGIGAVSHWRGVAAVNAPKAAQPAEVVEDARQAGAASASPPAATRTQRGGWVQGVSYVYDADYSTTLETDKNAADGSLTLAGSAVLSLTVMQVDAQKIVLQAALSELSLVSDTKSDQPHHIEDSAGAEMSKPFLITLNPSGRIESLSIEPSVRGLGHNILRILVAALQFVEPSGKENNPSSWVSEESDQNGRYRAHYRSVIPGEFQKTKEYTFLDIEQKITADTNTPKPTVVSEAKVTHRQPGPPQRVEVQESLIAPISVDKAFHAESHTVLAFKDAQIASNVVPLDARHLVASELFQARALDTRQAEARREEELLGHATFEQLVADLDGLAPSNENRDARYHVTARLTALFNKDPGAIDTAVLKMRRNLKPGDGEVLLAALADARVPQAQAALTRVAQDQAIPEDVRQASVTQLALLNHPNSDTISALGRMSDDTSDPSKHAAATLALGGAARRGADDPTSAKAAEESTDSLVQRFKGASTPEDQALYLEALGNTGSAHGMEAIKAGLASADPRVRDSAVSALRFVTGPEADALIARAFTTDPDPHVRATGIHILSRRTLSPELLEALANSVHSETVLDVRIVLANVLGELAPLPACVELLRWMASNERFPESKEAASRALNAGVVAAQ